tara:strand:+ start:419 stop:601 length:183 start_codon:yes stop_codon:yes gene_type:complete
MKLGIAKTKKGAWFFEASTLNGQIIIIGIHTSRSFSFMKIFYTEEQATSYIAKLTSKAYN